MNAAAYTIIDLAAIKHNIQKIREYAPKAKIMAVIKANAYGHGSLRIASALNDIDALAVARLDEGIELRKAGHTIRIIVLGGFVGEQELDNLMRFNLDSVVHSLEQVAVFEHYKGQQNITVWLKLDTGMNRLGLKDLDFTLAYQRLVACSCINQPIALMTHLSNADDTKSDITLKQIALFKQTVKQYQGEKSIANSAGVIVWPDSLSDWVRPGIMLYGISPFNDKEGAELALKPVMSLHSRLIAVKHIAAGEAVGYAGSWVSEQKTRLGVVAIGYADGYPRQAKNGTPVLVNKQRVALLGRVSMDMITVDLSTQPQAKVGDSVILWGENLAIEEIARYSMTIPYTLLCGITARVAIKNTD